MSIKDDSECGRIKFQIFIPHTAFIEPCPVNAAKIMMKVEQHILPEFFGGIIKNKFNTYMHANHTSLFHYIVQSRARYSSTLKYGSS